MAETDQHDQVIKIEGKLFDGQSSRSHVGKLYCSPDGLVSWHSDDLELNQTFRADQLNISPRIGNTPRYITFPNESKFETSHNDQVDYVIKHYVSKSLAKTSVIDAWAHQLEKAKSFIAITIVIVAFFSWGMIQYGIPYFSKTIAHALPEEMAYKIGTGGLELFDEALTEPSEISIERQDELINQFNKLLPDNADNRHFELLFRKSDTLGANAFAFPSGQILFTDEMIRLAKNDQELQTIMLHEIGHVVHRHSLQRIIQQSGLALVVFVLTGDAGTTSSLILALPTLLLEAQYTQDMETEADIYAFEHLDKHNLAPEHFVNIMTRLSALHEHSHDHHQDKKEQHDQSDITDYFSSHPPTQERIERFKQAY